MPAEYLKIRYGIMLRQVQFYQLFLEANNLVLPAIEESFCPITDFPPRVVEALFWDR
jgi:hypothetical protein